MSRLASPPECFCGYDAGAYYTWHIHASFLPLTIAFLIDFIGFCGSFYRAASRVHRKAWPENGGSWLGGIRLLTAQKDN
jgi:hypothetical protein